MDRHCLQWIVIGAIGHHWCHQLLLDVLTFTSPRNGANGAILIDPLVTNGDRHWRKWGEEGGGGGCAPGPYLSSR